MSDNLSLSQVAAAQLNKYLTINNKGGELDAAITEVLTVSVNNSNAATVTQASLQRAVILRITEGAPTPTAAITITIGTAFERGFFAVDNQTAQNVTVTISGQPATPPVIPAGEVHTLVLDGTDVLSAGGGSSGGGNISVEEDSTGVVATASILNFTGGGVSVTDGGGGEAVINIPSGALGGSPGPWEFLETIDLAGSTTVNFTNIGGSQHVQLMLVWENVVPGTDGQAWGIRLNYGSGFETSYRRANPEVSSDAVEDNNVNQTAGFMPLAMTPGNASTEGGCGHMYINNPFIVGQKFMYGLGAHSQQNTAVTATHVASVSNAATTAAITAIQAIVNSGVFTSGKVHLYGLRAFNPPAAYFIDDFASGAPAASQIMLRHVFPGNTSFLEHVNGSVAKAKVAATAQTDFDIQKNAVSVGTMRFAAAATVATFIVTGGVDFVAGDDIEIIAPGSPDATLAGVAVTLVGFHDLTAIQDLWIGGMA